MIRKKETIHRGSGILDPVDVRLGAQVRELRIQRGLSQMQLGVEIGLTFQQVQKYERGTNRISVATLVRICRVLKVAPGQLVDRLSDPPPDAEHPPSDRKALVATRELLNLQSEPVRGAVLGLLRAIAGRTELGGSRHD
ncbi:MAG: family transcriptional regulator [Rhodospirillales bacterium]|nr:family transcriptional regulator [Rhodospirillales bacterium]